MVRLPRYYSKQSRHLDMKHDNHNIHLCPYNRFCEPFHPESAIINSVFWEPQPDKMQTKNAHFSVALQLPFLSENVVKSIRYLRISFQVMSFCGIFRMNNLTFKQDWSIIGWTIYFWNMYSGWQKHLWLHSFINF